jgi:uncharacterized phage protein (TIGR01671 family)
MNREIRFRGIRQDNNEWAFGNLLRQDNGPCYILPIVFRSGSADPKGHRTVISAQIVYGVDPSTVGQYTGLKDREGKEIYEGDILDEFCLDKYRNRYYITPALVTYEGAGFKAEGVSISDKSLKVIGNIHENPELLEERR